MLSKRIIPCVDIRDGRVVKGIRFQGLRDAGDPVEQVSGYVAQGADEIVMLDVSATPEGRATARDVVAALREVVDVPLTVGGGVRRIEDAHALLCAGADKVAINTAAFESPRLITELSEAFGRQCIVISVDAARVSDRVGWEVVTRSGKNRTGVDAIAWIAETETLGGGEILLTSWDQDGTKTGYDCDLLSEARSVVGLPVIASGGAATVDHMADAISAGADAVLAATIFHDGETTVDSIKRQLLERQIEVRTC